MNTRPNLFPNDHIATHQRFLDSMEKKRERDERREEALYERLHLDITSLAQQLTGISVICTFIASMTVALISLAFDMFSTKNESEDWTQGHIYLLWYLALIYSFTTAIASGASAVFAFAHANGRIDSESKGRVTADRDRMSRLVLGYAVCFGISVVLLFLGLLVFIWAEHDRSITIMAGIVAGPLWVWVMFKMYLEWNAVVKWEATGAEGGRRLWRLWPEFPWSAMRQRKTATEKVQKKKEDV